MKDEAKHKKCLSPQDYDSMKVCNKPGIAFDLSRLVLKL